MLYVTKDTHVLVVEDDPSVRDVVRRYLERDGHRVSLAYDGEGALRAADDSVDLVVLDVMLPGMDGLQVCQRLRDGASGRPDVPVIMLTALGEEDDRIAGLSLGADDYVTKPFSPRELSLRVTSVLRRSANGTERNGQPALRDGDLVVDVPSRRVTLRGEELPLTLREFDLLTFLLGHPGQAFTRSDLLGRVWGWSFGDHSTVTVHVKRLRHKIEDDPSAPTRISTVYGLGYRYDQQSHEEPDT
ncbi:MAG: response regulator transcription factor [Nocardioidaceae bacterium]